MNIPSSDQDDSDSSLTDPRIRNKPIPSEFPVTIWMAGRLFPPGLVDTVSSNIKIMLNAFGVPAVAVIYYRMKCTAISSEFSHLFIAIDEKQKVIRIQASRLSQLTSIIDPLKMKEYTASITSDPLGALLLRAGGGKGERFNRFPPIFGFRSAKGEAHVNDRTTELAALRQDGYFALTFLPVPGVDYRLQLASEIASLWGFSFAGHDKNWPDLLVLRNEIPDREDLGGVPDETWMNHALLRVLEDHLPVVEIDGLWMGSLPRGKNILESRGKVLFAVLDWIKSRRLPYITARTFHCYVRRDLSAVVSLGSLRDKTELVAWLNDYNFTPITVNKIKGEVAAAERVFSSGGGGGRSIALRDSGSDNWLVIGTADGQPPPTAVSSLEKTLREYYGNPQTCGALGSPVTSADIKGMSLASLLKIVRVAECEAAASGVCLSSDTASASADSSETSWTASHRAYRSAVRSHVLRTHDTIGIYRMGPYPSPFFAFEVQQYTPMPAESRYRAMVSQVALAPDVGESEDSLLKVLVGKVWVLTIQEAATAESPESEVDVMQVASDRNEEEVRQVLFKAWKSGHMIGTWCRVMLTHRESLSVSVAGGTVDPLLAHAGDSVVDGNRWLDVTEKALKDCAV